MPEVTDSNELAVLFREEMDDKYLVHFTRLLTSLYLQTAATSDKDLDKEFIANVTATVNICTIEYHNKVKKILEISIVFYVL